MRVLFQEKPYDLVVSVSYAVGLAAGLLVTGARSLFAVLLIVIVPGYVLVAALFPGNDGIDWLERIALSLALSIVVVSLVGLVLDATPWGIRLGPIVVALALFTGIGACVGYLRRMHLPIERRLAATLDFDLSVWSESSRMDKVVTVALSLSVVSAATVLLYFITVAEPGKEFTEFYILGPGGNASRYPTTLKVSEPGTVILGIANHEAASLSYTIRIDLVGVRLVYNATLGFNETVEVNRTTWSSLNVPLTDGQNWTQSYTFRINATGLWKVQFLLFKDEGFSSAYRELHLYVRVS